MGNGGQRFADHSHRTLKPPFSRIRECAQFGCWVQGGCWDQGLYDSFCGRSGLEAALEKKAHLEAS
eukprot:10656205-Alexandrium_andersonii.AAC.1